MDIEKVPKVLEEAKKMLPYNTKVTEHIIHSDSLTVDERNQISAHGKILNPMQQLNVKSHIFRGVFDDFD
jgi:hypothetical protein